jgi:predicted DNA-binding protein with PD1-like motif
MKMIGFVLQILGFLFWVNTAMAQNNPNKRYIKVPAGYLMVLRQGDNVLAHIEELAEKEKIPSANFSGMGFIHVKFGFFNFETKQYEPREFRDVELASMTGSIAWQNNKVSLHTHGVVTDKTFAAYGGHMLEASVSTGSVEILVTLHDKPLERIMEQPLGANVLNLGHE